MAAMNGTVMVALAGILATLLASIGAAWIGYHGIARQLKFQGKQDKRRIYSTALAALRCAWDARLTAETIPSAEAEAESRTRLQMAAVSVAEVRLVGGLGDKAQEVLDTLDRREPLHGFRDPYTALIESMKRDLGETHLVSGTDKSLEVT